MQTGQITCPKCQTRTRAEMPEDACVHVFECPECRTLLRPLSGDCCVFCSYGDVRCPPQRENLGYLKRTP